MEYFLILLRFFCEFCTKMTNIHVWCALSSPNIDKLCIWYEYKHLVIIKCQMWLQVMEHSLILLCILDIVIHYYWRPLMSEVLYLHQTFTDCILDWFTHFCMSTCQMRSLIMLRFCAFSHINIIINNQAYQAYIL